MKKLIIVLFLISNIFADSIKIGLVHNISTGEIPNGINIYSYLVSPTQNWGVFYRQKNENDYKCIFAIYDIRHNTLIEQISDKNLCNNEDIEDGYELYNGSFFQPFIDKYKNKIELLSQKYNLNDSFDYSNVIIKKSKQLNYIFTIKTNQEKKDVLYKDDRLIFKKIIDKATNQQQLLNDIAKIRKQYNYNLAYNADGTPRIVNGSDQSKNYNRWINRVNNCLGVSI